MTGITITTRNRPEVLEYTLSKLDETLTDETVIVIDDNSDNHTLNRQIVAKFGFIYLLNKTRRGIPRSKYRGFMSLLDHERQFWFDDDCYPLPGWQDRCIEAMEHQGHLLYLKEWAHIQPVEILDNGLIKYNSGTACFMAFTSDLYKQMEGFTADFLNYGHWHNWLSLQCGGFYSLDDIQKYIYSFDLDGSPDDFNHNFSSCISHKERMQQLRKYYHDTGKQYSKMDI